MGVLIDGEWVDGELPQEIASSGAFERTDSRFRDRITADGASGFKAERDRYHLYVAHGCPWAHRALIYLAAKELESVISVAYAIPGLRERGWTFERDDRYPDCLPDDVNGFRHLYEAYVASDPAYTGKVTVPTLWDRKRKRIVNNESSEIIRMFNVEFNAVTGERTDFYPSALRAEIDAVNERVYRTVNNGVYRAGFATSQSAYDEAYDGLFDTPTVSGRRSDHGSRLAAVSDPRPFRRRVFPAVQMQPAAHRRLSEPVQLHARALPGAGHRSHGEAAILRDQLLRDRQSEPHAHHSEGHAARPRSAA
jgi:glutathionyl-hydroquinone reductase